MGLRAGWENLESRTQAIQPVGRCYTDGAIPNPIVFIKKKLNVTYWTEFNYGLFIWERLCGLVVRVVGYRSGGPGSIPGTTRKKSNWSGTGSTQPREYN
jgi:hypothetical protein